MGVFTRSSVYGSDPRVMSAAVKIKKLSPAIGHIYLPTGRAIKSGRMLAICEGTLYAYQGEEKHHVAVMQAAMICIQGERRPS